MEERKLSTLSVGESAMTVRIEGEGPLRRRMLDMGITKGCTICVKNFAPLGDPMEIELRGYHLTVRKKDAEMIYVSAAPEDEQ